MAGDRFEQMAMAVASKGELTADQKLTELKAQRDQIMKAFDFKIGETESEKSAFKFEKDKINLQKKEEKLQSDLISSMLEKHSQGVFIGADPAEKTFNPNPFPMGAP